MTRKLISLILAELFLFSSVLSAAELPSSSLLRPRPMTAGDGAFKGIQKELAEFSSPDETARDGGRRRQEEERRKVHSKKLNRTIAELQKEVLDLKERNAGLRKENAKYRRLAYRDSVTGLWNRHYYNALIKRMLQQEDALPVSILHIDLDHFKKINDLHGHPIGDKVLRHVATLLKTEVRRNPDQIVQWRHVATRTGGEELIVVLPATTLNDAAIVAERIREAIASHPEPKTKINVTVSIGVAAYEEGDTAKSLYKRSDEALYLAKKGDLSARSKGRNQVKTMMRGRTKLPPDIEEIVAPTEATVAKSGSAAAASVDTPASRLAEAEQRRARDGGEKFRENLLILATNDLGKNDLGGGNRKYLTLYQRKGKYLPTAKLSSDQIPYYSELSLRDIKPIGVSPQSPDQIPRVRVSLPETDIFLISQILSGSAGVVRLGFLEEDGRAVALKTSYPSKGDFSEQDALSDYRGAQIADQLGFGPKVYGLFTDRDGRPNIVTDVVPGDFPRAMRRFITPTTIRDLREINRRLVTSGRRIVGDFQYFVTPTGRIQVIDQRKIDMESSKWDDYPEKLAFLLDVAPKYVKLQALTEIAREDPELLHTLEQWLKEDRSHRDLRMLSKLVRAKQFLSRTLPGDHRRTARDGGNKGIPEEARSITVRDGGEKMDILINDSGYLEDGTLQFRRVFVEGGEELLREVPLHEMDIEKDKQEFLAFYYAQRALRHFRETHGLRPDGKIMIAYGSRKTSRIKVLQRKDNPWLPDGYIAIILIPHPDMESREQQRAVSQEKLAHEIVHLLMGFETLTGWLRSGRLVITESDSSGTLLDHDEVVALWGDVEARAAILHADEPMILQEEDVPLGAPIIKLAELNTRFDTDTEDPLAIIGRNTLATLGALADIAQRSEIKVVSRLLYHPDFIEEVRVRSAPTRGFFLAEDFMNLLIHADQRLYQGQHVSIIREAFRNRGLNTDEKMARDGGDKSLGRREFLKTLLATGAMLPLLTAGEANAEIAVDKDLDPELRSIFESAIPATLQFLTMPVTNRDPDVQRLSQKAKELFVDHHMKITFSVADLQKMIANDPAFKEGAYNQEILSKGTARAMVTRIGPQEYRITYDYRMMDQGVAALITGLAHEVLGHMSVPEEVLKGLSPQQEEALVFRMEIKYLEALLDDNKETVSRFEEEGGRDVIRELRHQIESEKAILAYLEKDAPGGAPLQTTEKPVWQSVPFVVGGIATLAVAGGVGFALNRRHQRRQAATQTIQAAYRAATGRSDAPTELIERYWRHQKLKTRDLERAGLATREQQRIFLSQLREKPHRARDGGAREWSKNQSRFFGLMQDFLRRVKIQGVPGVSTTFFPIDHTIRIRVSGASSEKLDRELAVLLMVAVDADISAKSQMSSAKALHRFLLPSDMFTLLYREASPPDEGVTKAPDGGKRGRPKKSAGDAEAQAGGPSEADLQTAGGAAHYATPAEVAELVDQHGVATAETEEHQFVREILEEMGIEHEEGDITRLLESIDTGDHEELALYLRGTLGLTNRQIVRFFESVLGEEVPEGSDERGHGKWDYAYDGGSKAAISQAAQKIRDALIKQKSPEGYRTMIDLLNPGILGEILTRLQEEFGNTPALPVSKLILRELIQTERMERMEKNEEPPLSYRDDLLKPTIPVEQTASGKVIVSASLLGKFLFHDAVAFLEDMRSRDFYFLPTEHAGYDGFIRNRSLDPRDKVQGAGARRFVLFVDDEDFKTFAPEASETIYGPAIRDYGEVIVIKATQFDPYAMLKVGQALLSGNTNLYPAALDRTDRLLLETLTELPREFPPLTNLQKELDYITPIVTQILTQV